MAHSIEDALLIMTEDCEMIPDRRAVLELSPYARASSDYLRPPCFMLSAVLLSLMLSGAALLLNAHPQKHASTQHVPGRAEAIMGVCNRTPSAHLTAPRPFNSSVGYLKWEYQIGHSHLIGFDYENGSLIVPSDGNYRIYLQIWFRKTDTFHCNEKVLVLNQTVLLYAKGYTDKDPLLVSSDTVNCREQYWEKTLYTSGIFALQAGDRLCVEKVIRFQELMFPHETKTFFGAHRI
ncbi:hypothetical protein DPEC_G00261940 [Dallia pectoralis]|uniref:Uncharacterized protein n=1 Tax=Dallia pectoralis TaxID=75939 RepID=A0ACC2FRZ5_DALPE|nr:hypothetical protein DPEC_G00261940 [Dallia pectoralis]